MEFLGPTSEIILEPLYDFGKSLEGNFPGILWFIIITIVGYFIASFFGWTIKKILYRINVDKRLRKVDLHDSLGNVSLAKIAGRITKGYIFILFLDQAVSYLNFGAFSRFLNKLVDWLPDLILSIIIIIIGMVFIDFVVNKLLELKNRYVEVIANIIKAILIVVVVFTAIEQIGIKTDLAQNIFLIVVASVFVTFALAFGIGFGLSLKDELKPVIKKYRKKIK